MKSLFTASQVRAAERPLLDAGVPLMSRAAFALYQHVSRVVQDCVGVRTGTRSLSGGRTVFVVGPGNNGGDALFAAARLAARPVDVCVVVAGDRVHEQGLAAVRRTQARVVIVAGSAPDHIYDEVVALVRRADVVVDGLLGIGATGAPRGVVADLIRCLEFQTPRAAQHRRPIVIAVDVPSGVDASTGIVADPQCVIAADLTVTFGAHKIGLYTDPGTRYAGAVECVDIGVDSAEAPDAWVVEPSDFVSDPELASIVSTPDFAAHKYTRGVVGIYAGSLVYPGAGILATGAAAASGVGMVRFLGEPHIAQEIVGLMPHVVTVGGRVQSWVVGSGMHESDGTRRSVLELLSRPEASVIDAGALGMLRDQDALTLAPRHVLTPHAGELARLLHKLGYETSREAVEADLLAAARELHRLTGSTVVAKGPVTVIVGADGTYVVRGASARLATAGSGDALAGILGATLAHAIGLVDAGGSESHEAAGQSSEDQRSEGQSTEDQSFESQGDSDQEEPIDYNLPWAKLAAAAVAIHAAAGNIAARADAHTRAETHTQARAGAHAYRVPSTRAEEAANFATQVHRGQTVSRPIVASDIVAYIPAAHESLAQGHRVFE